MAAWLGAAGAAVATAQDKPAAPAAQPIGAPQQSGASQPNGSQPNLAALQQNVVKTTSDWSALANAIEARISRWLPCDPRIRTAIEEVSRASEARLDALSRYAQAVMADAGQQTDVARRLVAGQDALAAEWNTERVQAQQEDAGIQGQMANITESAKRRPALSEAQRTLGGIAAAAGQRVTQDEDRVNRAAALPGLLRDLLAADQARQAAYSAEIRAVADEQARWGTYYAARLGRAQIECTITNPGGAAAAPGRQGKKR